jgi:antitoxin FitA
VPINVSVKNVPDELADRLKKRARRHHRSLQGELLAIIEEATNPEKISFEEAEIRLKSLNFKTPDESQAWIRELRNAR